MVTISEMMAAAFQAFRSGRLSEAESACQQVLHQEPGHAPALHLLGVMRYQRGRVEGAILYYQQAIAADPDFAEAHNSLGVALQARRDLPGAIAAFQRALELKPDYLQAHYNLGNAFQEGGMLEAAIAQFRQVLTLNPYHLGAINNLGIALQRQGRLEESIVQFRQALVIDPTHAPAQTNLGNALQDQGDLATALDYYRAALALQPADADTHSNLAKALHRMGKLEEAIDHYQQSIILKPRAQTCNSLGLVLRHQGDLQGAIAQFQSALQLDPQCADALANLGDVFLDQDNPELALRCFDRSLQLRPDHSHAHCQRGFTRLLDGDLAEGFSEYVPHFWRWKHPSPEADLPPWWEGGDLTGQTLLLDIEDEGGVEDGLQYIRYAPLLVERGGRVIVRCPNSLVRLLQSAAGVEAIVSRSGAIPPCQVYLPAMGLPVRFQTTLETVPASVPYLFPPPELNLVLESPPNTHTVGLVWGATVQVPSPQGNRSCPIAYLAPLLEVPNLAFFSLQTGAAAEDIGQLGEAVADLRDYLRDFAEIAAAIVQLDLVITVDHAIAHLAGAMGQPVWVMLPFAADCRWLRSRGTSPWYPTLRLFRQTAPGDWHSVVSQVAQALTDWRKN